MSHGHGEQEETSVTETSSTDAFGEGLKMRSRKCKLVKGPLLEGRGDSIESWKKENRIDRF
jgi:hypothetical protein